MVCSASKLASQIVENARNPRFSALVDLVGPPIHLNDVPKLPSEESPSRHVISSERAFKALLRSITSQQLNKKVADKMYANVIRILETDEGTIDESVEGYLAAAASRKNPEVLKGETGLSKRKAEFIVSLGRAFVENRLNEVHLLDPSTSDDAVADQLRPLPGIGPWTVDMFNIFCRRSLNVFPGGDLAVRNAMIAFFDLQPILNAHFNRYDLSDLAKQSIKTDPARVVRIEGTREACGLSDSLNQPDVEESPRKTMKSPRKEDLKTTQKPTSKRVSQKVLTSILEDIASLYWPNLRSLGSWYMWQFVGLDKEQQQHLRSSPDLIVSVDHKKAIQLIVANRIEETRKPK